MFAGSKKLQASLEPGILLMKRRKFALVRAQESTDCGAAALATVALHYGLKTSLLRLRELTNTDLQGAAIDTICKAAATLGFDASWGKVKQESLDSIPVPAIAHLQNPAGHFIVIHQVNQNDLVVADPADGIVILRKEEFLLRSSGQVVLLEPGPEFCANRIRNDAIHDVLGVVLRQKQSLAISILFAFAITSCGIGTSISVGSIVDHVIPKRNTLLLELLATAMAMMLVVRTVFGGTRQLLLSRLALKIELSEGLRYLQHLLSLPTSFYDKRPAGDLFARVFDVSKLSSAVAGPILSLFIDLSVLMICTAAMAYYNRELALLTMSLLLLAGPVTFVTVPALRRKDRLIRIHMSALANAFMETLGNMRVVKAYSAETASYNRISDCYVHAQRAMYERNVFAGIALAISSFISDAMSLILVCLGAVLVLRSQLTTGELISFYAVLALFLSSIQHLAPSIAQIQDAFVAAERLKDIVSLQSEVRERSLQSKKSETSLRSRESERCSAIAPNCLRGSVQMQGISFDYRPGYPVLSEISLDILAGSTVAIVGQTGSGKTTLAYLLAGLYNPTAGQILIDNVDIREISIPELRSKVTVVFQESGLMSGTVAENISLGRPATMLNIQNVASLACAHDFIQDLPRRYESQVGSRGSILSAGQRQRIAIARALLRNPQILILDEATSNLDPETERKILNSLRLDAGDRTTVIITHRMATAARAHFVFVLHAGNIVEAGTHDQLLIAKGKYYSMWLSAADESDAVKSTPAIMHFS